MISQFSLGHMILLVPTVLVFTALTVLLATKLKEREKLTRGVIVGVLFFGFFLHFARIIPLLGNHDWHQIVFTISPKSICAVSAMMFPFAFLFGGRTIRDYMFYVGIVTALIALIIPGEIFGQNWYEFDSIRFYLMHAVIVFAPIMMVACGFHKIVWHTSWRTGYIILCVFAVILADIVLMSAIGFLELDLIQILKFPSALDGAVAIIFGPIPGGYFLVDACPEIFRTAPIDVASMGLSRGEVFYWPIVWLLFPAVVVFLPVFFIAGILIDLRGFRYDIKYTYLLLTGKFDRLEQHEKTKKLSRLKPSHRR